MASQLGLMALGMAVGFAPSYAVLAFLKFTIGGLQQVRVNDTIVDMSVISSYVVIASGSCFL